MTSLSVNGNLIYNFVGLNMASQFDVSVSTIPAAGTLDILDGTSVIKTLRVDAGTLLNTNKFNITLDSGEHSLVAVLRDSAGAEKERSQTVLVSVPEGGQFSPRFGLHDKVTSIAGYDSAFFKSLTTKLGTEGEQFVTCPPNSSTSDNGKFFYVAWPKALGYGYFRDYTSGSYGFSGSWDGAQEFDDFNFAGPAEISLEGFDYIIYRNDFPFDSVDYVFSILYGSTTPGSGSE